MNIKTITTMALLAVALVVSSIAPAQAYDNKKYLNQLAMQYYFQNLAANGRTNIYNPALTANYSYAASPWSAGVIPTYNSVIAPLTTSVLPVSTAINPYAYSGAYNNVAYNTIVSPQYSNLSAQIANLQARLAANNLSSWQAARLQNQIAALQARTNGLASTGYGAPYGHRTSVFNNLRNSMRI